MNIEFVCHIIWLSLKLLKYALSAPNLLDIWNCRYRGERAAGANPRALPVQRAPSDAEPGAHVLEPPIYSCQHFSPRGHPTGSQIDF